MLIDDLATPLTKILEKRATDRLASARGIETVGDLLWFLPRRHLDRHSDVAELVDGAYLVAVGTVEDVSTRPMRARHGTMLTAHVRVGDDIIDVTFFDARAHRRRLVEGASGVFAGTVGRYRGAWQLAHPAYDLFTTASSGPEGGALDALSRPLIPVYREVKGLPSWTIARCVETVLGVLELADPLPAELATRHGLASFAEAMRMVHLPTVRSEVSEGRRRLVYDEALTIQLVLARRRADRAAAKAVPRRRRPGGLLDAFDARLPFALTPGQVAVGDQIAADLASPHPMNRLLQGEVGSGKTLVALRAMLAVVDSGGQAALLAPTEVLAAQHHRSLLHLLGDLALGGMLGGASNGTRVALLTGGASAPARKAALLDAASGGAGIVVGTHALIQDRVQFADLGLVVVDEQHRFGVEQRDALRGKAAGEPHLLVMTATPIPRTVAMTVFGDLDTSTLREVPAGRANVTTHIVDNPRWYERAWTRLAEEVGAGRQAYVVCPRIGDDTSDDDAYADASDLGDPPEEGGGPDPGEPRPMVAVLTLAEELAGRPELAGVRLAVLHGRLPADEKEAVMTAFAAGDIDVLVATTVVEVGLDVPNASVMVVMDADRFGVSQLHQLRGRVGRGAHPGLCLLVTNDPGPVGAQRLDALARTNDGFALARIDVEQRREGDILGAQQSGGATQLRLLSLRRDEDVIVAARADAIELVAADPGLARHPQLRAAAEAMIDDDQAAFLQRG